MLNSAYQNEIPTEMSDGNIFGIFKIFSEGKTCTVFSDGVGVFLSKKIE